MDRRTGFIKFSLQISTRFTNNLEMSSRKAEAGLPVEESFSEDDKSFKDKLSMEEADTIKI